jgi:hypothetical protein
MGDDLRYNCLEYMCKQGARGGVVVKAYVTKRQVAGSITDGVIRISQ